MKRCFSMWLAAWIFSASSAVAEDVSIERGRYISIIGGCHDCHTEGYRKSSGTIDPEKALRGSSIGFQGPWGTSYPANLRLTADNDDEDEFVLVARHNDATPPMPWYNLRQMHEADVRSLYRYIRSLGDVGKPAPLLVAPGEKVMTPYIVFDPPISPPACTRDFDCGTGLVCDPAGSGLCVPRG